MIVVICLAGSLELDEYFKARVVGILSCDLLDVCFYGHWSRMKKFFIWSCGEWVWSLMYSLEDGLRNQISVIRYLRKNVFW